MAQCRCFSPQKEQRDSICGDCQRESTINDSNDKIKVALLDQLYRFEGALGIYNCQHGGTKCDFQTNCHRLIREEIDFLKEELGG